MDWVGEPFVASGQVAGLNGTIAFFKFRPPDQPQVEEYCYFRNHRVFVDGEKVSVTGCLWIISRRLPIALGKKTVECNSCNLVAAFPACFR